MTRFQANTTLAALCALCSAAIRAPGTDIFSDMLLLAASATALWSIIDATRRASRESPGHKRDLR